jgi:hypothetical protein
VFVGHLLVPVCDHEQHPGSREVRPEVSEQLSGGRVGPVEVVDDDDEACGCGRTAKCRRHGDEQAEPFLASERR